MLSSAVSLTHGPFNIPTQETLELFVRAVFREPRLESCPSEEFVSARKRAKGQLNKTNKTISNLLDNITSSNRQFADQRLDELKQKKLQLEYRLEQLHRLSLSREEINNIVSDSMKFLACLEFVLSEMLPVEP